MFSGRKGWSRQRRKRRPRLNGFTRLFNGMNFFSYLVIFEKYLSFSERTICIEKTFNGMFSEAEKKSMNDIVVLGYSKWIQHSRFTRRKRRTSMWIFNQNWSTLWNNSCLFFREKMAEKVHEVFVVDLAYQVLPEWMVYHVHVMF